MTWFAIVCCFCQLGRAIILCLPTAGEEGCIQYSTLLIPPGSETIWGWKLYLSPVHVCQRPLTERKACGTKKRQHSCHLCPEYSHTKQKYRRRMQIIWTVFHSSKPNYVKKLSFLKFFLCTLRFFETCSAHADRFPVVVGIKPSHLSPVPS